MARGWASQSSAASLRIIAGRFGLRKIARRHAIRSRVACRTGSGLEAGYTLSMHNILIVDDEPGIQQSLKGVLEDEGYKASVADSGEDCLEIAPRRSASTSSCSTSGCRESTASETLQRIR